MNSPLGRKPTIRDVAAAAGVSTKTVSNFLNQKKSYSSDTAERIQRAVEELNFRPNLSARSLRGGKHNTVAIAGYGTVVGWTDPVRQRYVRAFEDRLMSGVYVRCGLASMGIIVLPPDLGVRGRDADNLSALAIDGMLYGGHHHLPTDPISPRQLANFPFPLVQVGRNTDTPLGHSAVLSDERETMRIATEYLLSMGHRRIAYIGGPGSDNEALRDDEAMAGRYHYFRHFMKEADCFEPSLRRVSHNWFGDGVAEHVKELLEYQPTALLCFNDFTALDAIEAVHALGLSVPEDISVMGIDDIMLAELRGLTTVAVAAEQVGQKAIDLILKGEPAAVHRIANATLSPRNTVIPRNPKISVNCQTGGKSFTV
jgi:LacI family transcriptional regulator